MDVVKTCDAGRDRRWGDGLSLLVLVFAAVTLASLFGFHCLPHNDFPQFAAPAKSYLNLEPPPDYKIMPAYPAAIALASLVCPNDDELVTSTRLVSLLAGLVMLWSFWRIARRHLPRTAPLLLLFLAVHPGFLEFSTQTLMAMFIAATVGLTLWLFALRNSGCYLSSALVSLSRYDAIFLTPILALVRLVETGWKKKYFVYGVLSGAGFIAWVGLSWAFSTHVNPYLEELATSTDSPGCLPLLRMLTRSLIGTGGSELWSPLRGVEIAAVGLVALVMLIGCWRLWRSDRSLLIVGAGFLITYFGVHAVFKAANYRYNYPLLPLLTLFFFLALEPTRPRQRSSGFRPSVLMFTLLGLGLLLATVRRLDHLNTRLIWVFSVAFVSIFLTVRRAYIPGRLPGLCLAWMAILFGLGLQVRVWDRHYGTQKMLFSEHLAVGDWAQQNCGKGEKLLMTGSYLLQASHPRSLQDRLVDTGGAGREDPVAYLLRVWNKGVRYVAWMTHHQHDTRGLFWHRETGSFLFNEFSLDEPKSRPGFAFVRTLTQGPRHRVNLFRLCKADLERSLSMMDPAQEDLGRKRLLRGWRSFTEGPAQERFVWAMSKRASLALFLADHRPGAHLDLTCSPYQEKGGPDQDLHVYINDHHVGHIRLQARLHTYSLRIEPQILQSGRNQVEFRFSFLGRPADLKKSDPGFAARFTRVALIPNNGT